jgi:eukaryotic-like serine/threonine-protein kinase
LGLGSYVGRYRIVAELGRGGMANVFLAVAQGPQGVQKLVVLKALRSALAAEPEALSMFLDEARLAARLNHANIVQTYEVGTEGDRHVIVMEYLEGQPLSAVVRRAGSTGIAFTLPSYLRVVVSMLEGLHYAHELTGYDGSPLMFVHRDVSPQNVFLTYDGQVKLLDFGIAKAATSQNHTAAGVIKGKLAYMAPEQMVASRIDRRADVYSVGCILWAAATGEKLWRTTPGVEIVKRVVGGDVPSPRSVNPACDSEFERIVMKALKSDPEERYASAAALQEDLEAYCERNTGLARQKDVGAYVSSLFADTKAQLKVATERELRLAANAPPPPTSAHDTIVDLGPSGDLGSQESEAAPQEAPDRSGKGLWIAVALLIALAASALALRGRLVEPARAVGEPTKKANASSQPLSTGAEVAAARRTVALELRAEPLSAQLSLDGVPLTGNPVTKLLPRGDFVHRLDATAPGYEPASKEVVAERDASVVLSLSPSPAAKASKKQAAGVRFVPPPRAVPSVEPATTTPKAEPRCEQPFYFNEQGIKAIRPECL